MGVNQPREKKKNVIMIVSDTLRRDYLGCYGNKWVDTKHIDEFAKKSIIFDRYYAGSFPTMPNRADLFTGRFTSSYQGWAPLRREEIVLAEVLAKNGYQTMAVVDTPFFDRGGGRQGGYNFGVDGCYNYDRGFLDLERIRGQGRYDRIDINLQRRYETDYCAPATMLAASRWLERHYKEKFFLYVDTWDPHEPWDPPKWYTELYGFDWENDQIRIKSQRAIDYTEDEIKNLRALYAGEVTMVDRWVGFLLHKIEDLGLLENTLVLFTSDHGTYIGEHGYITKVAYKSHLYEEVAHIPLIMRLPDSLGKVSGHCSALCQPFDLMSTILHLTEIKIPESVHGKSLLPVIQGEEDEIHEIALGSCYLLNSHRIAVYSKEWCLMAVAADAPETIRRRGTIEKVRPSELYYLPSDPKQSNDLFDERKDVVEDLHAKMIKYLESIGTNKELLRRWEKIK